VQHALGHPATVPNAFYFCSGSNFGYRRGPSPKGTLFWQKAASEFMGVCAGFANTSLIQFEYPGRMNPYRSTFGRTYNVPNVDSVFSNVSVNTGQGPQVRDLINLMWTRQFNRSTLLTALQRSQRTNSQLINQLQNMFTSPQGGRQLRALAIWDLGISLQSLNNLSQQVRQLRGYAHVVTPYRLERDENNSNLWRLYIYDNNDAGNDSLFIRVNTNTGYWEYPQDTVNSSHQGTALFLMDPITEYLRDDPPAVFREDVRHGSTIASTTTGRSPGPMQEEHLSMYYHGESDILIRDLDRQAMGIQDGVTVNERRGEVLPIQPLSGGRAEPLGFFIPHGMYDVRLTDLSEEVGFGVSGDHFVYSYSRNDGEEGQTDNLGYNQEGLGIGNPDETTKQVRLTSAYQVETRNWSISVSDIHMTGRDSIFQSIEDESALRIENHGSDYSYTLTISSANEDSGQYFMATNVPWPPGSIHHIHRGFGDPETGVRVYVDEDSDAAFEDTLFLENEFPPSQEEDEAGIAEYMKNGFLFQDNLAFDWPKDYPTITLHAHGRTTEPDSASPYHPMNAYQSLTSAYGTLTDSLPFDDPERGLEFSTQSLRFFTGVDTDSLQLEKATLETVPDRLAEFIQARDISFSQIGVTQQSNPAYIVMQEQDGLAFPGLVYTNDMLYVDSGQDGAEESIPGLFWYNEISAPRLGDLAVESDFELTMQFQPYGYTDGEWTARAGGGSYNFHGKLMGLGALSVAGHEGHWNPGDPWAPGSQGQNLSGNYRLLLTELQIFSEEAETVISDSTVVALQPKNGRFHLAGIYDIENPNGTPMIVDGEIFYAHLITTSTEDREQLPDQYKLYSNYPNPFNPQTTIRYDLPKTSEVTLTIYNSLGQEVTTLVNATQDAGSYTVIWDGVSDLGRQVSSGVYFYRIDAGEYRQVRKMVLVR